MKILVINPGSTSTKLAVYEDDVLVWRESLYHSAEEVAGFRHINEQYDYRRQHVHEALEKAGIPLETAISTITANPAEILSLKGKGKVREGYDADLCVLDQGLEIQEVVARGKTVYRK